MKVSSRVLAVAAVALLPGLAAAQATAGDLSLGLNGTISSIGGGGGRLTFGSINGQVGYYFSPALQLRGLAGINIMSGMGGGTDVSGVFGGGASYNFFRPGKLMVPFAAGDLVINTSAGVGPTSYFLRPAVGFNYYFQRNASFLVDAGYGVELSNNAGGGLFNINFGLSFILPKKGDK